MLALQGKVAALGLAPAQIPQCSQRCQRLAGRLALKYQPFMERDKLNPQCVELAESVDKLTKAARKAVITVNDHSVYQAPTALSKHQQRLVTPEKSALTFSTESVLFRSLESAQADVETA